MNTMAAKMSMSTSEQCFYDRLKQCIRNTKLPAEKARKAKRMMREAQKELKDNYGTEDACYTYCFIAELMGIVEYLTQSGT